MKSMSGGISIRVTAAQTVPAKISGALDLVVTPNN